VTPGVRGEPHGPTLYMLHVMRVLLVVVVIALHHHELSVGAPVGIQPQPIILMLHHVAAATRDHLVVVRDKGLPEWVRVGCHVEGGERELGRLFHKVAATAHRHLYQITNKTNE
jgi:hypothetical protein